MIPKGHAGPNTKARLILTICCVFHVVTMEADISAGPVAPRRQTKNQLLHQAEQVARAAFIHRFFQAPEVAKHASQEVDATIDYQHLRRQAPTSAEQASGSNLADSDTEDPFFKLRCCLATMEAATHQLAFAGEDIGPSQTTTHAEDNESYIDAAASSDHKKGEHIDNKMKESWWHMSKSDSEGEGDKNNCWEALAADALLQASATARPPGEQANLVDATARPPGPADTSRPPGHVTQEALAKETGQQKEKSSHKSNKKKKDRDKKKLDGSGTSSSSLRGCDSHKSGLATSSWSQRGQPNTEDKNTLLLTSGLNLNEPTQFAGSSDGEDTDIMENTFLLISGLNLDEPTQIANNTRAVEGPAKTKPSPTAKQLAACQAQLQQAITLGIDEQERCRRRVEFRLRCLHDLASDLPRSPNRDDIVEFLLANNWWLGKGQVKITDELPDGS